MGNESDTVDSFNKENPQKREEKNRENIEKEKNNNETEENLMEHCLNEKI